MCKPMPNFREISTCRIAQEAKASVAQMVMICQRPPSISGARPKP